MDVVANDGGNKNYGLKSVAFLYFVLVKLMLRYWEWVDLWRKNGNDELELVVRVMRRERSKFCY